MTNRMWQTVSAKGIHGSTPVIKEKLLLYTSKQSINSPLYIFASPLSPPQYLQLYLRFLLPHTFEHHLSSGFLAEATMRSRLLSCSC